MIIQFSSEGEDYGLSGLVKMLRGRHNRLVFLIEKDPIECEYYYFDELEITDVIFKNQRIGEYETNHFVMFTVGNEKQEINLIRFLYIISQHGDCGHSFEIFNKNTGKYICWDGDGSDRVDSINFFENWKGCVYIDNCGDKTDYAYREHLRWCTQDGVVRHQYEMMKIKKNKENGVEIPWAMTDEDKAQIKKLIKTQLKKRIEKFNNIKDIYTETNESIYLSILRNLKN